MQVTVQKIWPLDPTKNSGGFKGTDGVNYYCEIGAYHMLAEGTTYEANARPYTSKSGKSSFIMPKDWHPPATIVGGAPPTSPPHPPTNTSQPAPQQSARLTNTTPDRDVLITATALMKSFIETGQFGLTDLETLMKACVPAARLMVKAACGTPSQ